MDRGKIKTKSVDVLKKILILTPFSLPQNPRVVKEYKALKTNGFTVKVLYAERDGWASNLIAPNKDFIRVGGKFGSFYYYLTRISHKLLKKILPIEFALNRVSLLLLFRAIFNKADLYIAHNLAALPIAAIVAKFYNSKCAFDAEDFHRQETTDDKNDFNYIVAKVLEDKYLSACDYVTAASPLIAQTYQSLYPTVNPVIINNVFELKKIQPLAKKKENDKLTLFWFSQTIGKGRGIEDVINALNLLNNPNIELHLLGSCTKEIESYFKDLLVTYSFTVKFYPPISSDNIFHFANQFDIGLALELKTPLNRDICLTNKIFSYLTSGLAIIASNTSAQTAFMEENKGLGFEYSIGDSIDLSKKINHFFKNRDFLDACKKKSLELAFEKYNWEKESRILLNNVNN